MTEDEMVGWHHGVNRHEFEQALGDGEGQGGLACCCPWGHKELDMTEQMNNKSSFNILYVDILNLKIKCKFRIFHICMLGSESATPWAVVHQAPLFMEFSRQQYWSGFPFPPPGDPPNPGIKLMSHPVHGVNSVFL